MQRIGIVFLNYWLGVSISVIDTIKVLAQNGFVVDVFINKENYIDAPKVDFSAFPNVNIIVIEPSQKLTRKIQDTLQNLPLQSNRGFIKKLKQWLLPIRYWWIQKFKLYTSIEAYYKRYKPMSLSYLRELATYVHQRKYNCLIGVEPQGLLAAYYALNQTGFQEIPLIYYNLELLQYSSSLNLNQRLMKNLEIVCSQKCVFTVIPDINRGKVFARENSIPENKLRYLPVSLTGQPVLVKGRYFRDLFNIPESKHIVLYAGNIREWAMCLEIVKFVMEWPKDCVLVMHTWKSDSKDDKYFQKIKNIAEPSRVYFSTCPVPYEKLAEVLSSADVGLALYRPIDANFSETGSSSNKLAQYSQVGLPVISNNIQSIRSVFDRFGNGVCVDHPEKISEALEIIYLNYDKYRDGAFETYKNHYNFSVAFDPILAEIMRMNKS
jgi:glycosyltransferase involved in cell wall biosynthesis